MHSYDNSHNSGRKANNWNLLGLFFKKEGIDFEEAEYKNIPNGDFEALDKYMKKLYHILTKRTVPSNPLGVSKNFQVIHMDEKTETYLLTNKGIEKLDASKELSQRDMKSLREASEKDKKDDDGKMTKNFMPYKQTGMSSGWDGKNSNQRNQQGGESENKNSRPMQKPLQDPYQRSYSGHGNQSMADSQHEIGMSMGGTDGKEMLQKKEENYRQINDKLNEFLANLLNYEAFSEDRGIVDVKSNMLYQSYAENVDLFSERFNEVFAEDLEANVDDLAITLIKDMNDLWKFTYFNITCIKNLSVHKNSFNKFVQMLESFCNSLVYKDAAKTQAFLKELFLNQIVLAIKKCQSYEKREKFVRMIYYFYPNDPKAHHEAIKIYKDKVEDIELFMQSLCIFLKEENDVNDNNRMLIKDFKHYAKFGLSSLRNSIKLSSLHLMSHLAL